MPIFFFLFGRVKKKERRGEKKQMQKNASYSNPVRILSRNLQRVSKSMPRATAGAAGSHGRGVPRRTSGGHGCRRRSPHPWKGGAVCACRRAGLLGRGNAKHLTAVLLLSPN